MADSMNTDTERMNPGVQSSANDDDTPLFGDVEIRLHRILKLLRHEVTILLCSGPPEPSKMSERVDPKAFQREESSPNQILQVREDRLIATPHGTLRLICGFYQMSRGECFGYGRRSLLQS